MKIILPFMFLLLISNAYGQQSEIWLNQLENPYFKSQKLKKKNEISKYIHYDFSALFIPQSEFLGFIGDDFKRFKIYYSSVNKSRHSPQKYIVKGITLVGNNKCDFEGTITIKQIREFEVMHYGCDDEFIDEGFKAQGALIGDYVFKENPNQKYSGVFKGIVTMYWYVNKNNEMLIDDIEADFSDGYNNNQFVGTWNEYGKDKMKICNWGEDRIPFSDDLDIGAAYFFPDYKYHKNGWDDFKGLE
jgi:hypothetical protein